MNLHDVVDILPEYLHIGAMCRLMRVSNVLHTYIGENMTLFNAYMFRLGLSESKKKVKDIILHKMKTTQRCKECGQRCTRKPRVCRICLRDPLNYFGMVTRRQIVNILHNDSVLNNGWKHSARMVISKLNPASRTVPYSTLLYWTRDLEMYTTSPITQLSLE